MTSWVVYFAVAYKELKKFVLNLVVIFFWTKGPAFFSF